MVSAARPALVVSLSISVGLSSLGCGHGARPAATPSTAQDNTPASDAILVDFHPRDSETWTVRRADDSYVCTLPCSYWVRPESGLVIRLEGSTPAMATGVPQDFTSFPVPAQLPANPGEKLTITVDRTHGLGTVGKLLSAPLAVTFGLMGIAFTALSTASLATGSKQVTSTTSGCTSASSPEGGTSASACTTRTDKGVAADIGGLAVGVTTLTLAVLCTVWFFHDREGGLRYEAASTRQGALRLRLQTGAIAVETPGARAWITPAGIAGTF